MSIAIDRTLSTKKDALLAYFRARAAEKLVDVSARFGTTQHKKRAEGMNRAVTEERDRILALISQVAKKEVWPSDAALPASLLVMHCANVVMIESRNLAWPYEYMAFSRRIGEIWEPLCAKCFELPVRDDVEFYVPPLFDDIKRRLTSEVHDFIQGLDIAAEDKESLLRYYGQVWQLVTSGEINLAADLHVAVDGVRYVVDFKSGFGSNEKGNLNRLLLVASIYKNIEPEEYECILAVRSNEDDNNSYLQVLKDSGLWDVRCGAGAYDKIRELSGFDLRAWLDANVLWESDLDGATVEQFRESDLLKYLAW